MRDHRTASSPLVLVAAALVLVAAVGVCPAQERIGDLSAWSRFSGWKVTRYELEGAPKELAGPLVKGLHGHGTWSLFGGRERPDFAPGALLEDLQRIRLFLAREGYPAARVAPRFTPDPARHSLGVTLAVTPGPPVRVGALRGEGWPEGVDAHDLVAELPLARGRRFRDPDLEQTEVMLAHRLQDAGYVNAEVDGRIAPRDSVTVDVVLAVDAGQVHVIDEVVVQGCSPDLVDVARRVLDLPPGTRYGRNRVQEAAAALRGTQLFRSVTVDHEVLAPGHLRLTVDLADARMRTLEAGVGTWMDNPWMVRAGWVHRNAFGHGRGVLVNGLFATHERNATLGYFWRGWLKPRARTSLTSSRRDELEAAYESREYRLEAVQSFRPGERSMWNVGVGIGYVDVTTLSPDVEDIPDSEDLLLETWLDRKWDGTDDPLYPTDGQYLRTTLTFAPPAPSFPLPYVLAQVDVGAYRPLGGPLTLAGRLRGGWARPLADAADLLANRRFYAGGYNTMRGRKRRELGPRDSDGKPRGGQAVILAGTELRSRLFGPLDAAAFVDAGQVWRRPAEVRMTDMEIAVGFDLDLRTPLGPLRGGHAWLVRAAPPDRHSTLWHIGIGYPW